MKRWQYEPVLHEQQTCLSRWTDVDTPTIHKLPGKSERLVRQRLEFRDTLETSDLERKELARDILGPPVPCRGCEDPLYHCEDLWLIHGDLDDPMDPVNCYSCGDDGCWVDKKGNQRCPEYLDAGGYIWDAGEYEEDDKPESDLYCSWCFEDLSGHHNSRYRDTIEFPGMEGPAYFDGTIIYDPGYALEGIYMDMAVEQVNGNHDELEELKTLVALQQ